MPVTSHSLAPARPTPTGLVGALLIALCLAGTAAAETVCDPVILDAARAVNDQLAYGPRGRDRCDGQYMATYSANTLAELVGVVRRCAGQGRPEARVTIDPGAVRRAALPLTIRASALSRKRHYRLDALHRVDKPFVWDTARFPSQLTLAQVGYLAWYTRAGRRVYVPVGLGGRCSARVEAIVWPTRELSHVSYILRTRAGVVVKARGGMGDGYFPRHAPISVALPAIAPGHYQLEVKLRGRRGRAVPLPVVELEIAP